MRLRGGFPDIEAVVCIMLEDSQGVPAYTRVPEAMPPVHFEVKRIEGNNDEFQDYPVVEVQAIAVASADVPNARDVAFALAENARQVIMASRRSNVGGALVDDSEDITPPVERPDENPDVRRVVGTYRFTMRRPYRP